MKSLWMLTESLMSIESPQPLWQTDILVITILGILNKHSKWFWCWATESDQDQVFSNSNPLIILTELTGEKFWHWSTKITFNVLKDSE